MMKKILTAILSACICTIAAAESVSVSDARIHARRFFGGNPELSPIESGRILGKTSATAPTTFYVVNNPSGGWVILSADDCASPILACSGTGAFPTSGFSPATLEWLSEIDSGISSLKAARTVQSKRIREQWASIGSGTKAGGQEVVLETAKWGQDAPFNNICPQINGKTTVTGCIATAIATVCRYHKWPEKGKGSSKAYTTSTNQISISSVDFSTHTYKWDDMPSEYDDSWSAVQKSAVATLLYDCGVMVEMDYGLSAKGGSGALARDITAALKTHLSYSGRCRMVERSHMDVNEWFSTITEEIDAGRPVIYSGITDTGEGHAFVCDGYDDCNMVHINWGWNGSCDGFFALTWLGDDGDSEEGFIGRVFNKYEQVILGIEPDKSGSQGTEAAEIFLYSDGSFSGITLKSGSITGGGSFTLDIGHMLNNSVDADYSGKMKAVLMDRNGNVKEDVSEASSLAIKKISDNEYADTTVTVQCRIDGTVAPGDAIAVMYTLPDSSWTRMGGDSDRGTISLMGVYDVCFIANPFTYDAGECIYPSLIQGHGAVQKIEWYYDGKLMSKGFAYAESGTHTLKAVVTMASGLTETVAHPITVN